MARINDLTTFPNQQDPAPTDHVLGTDVSDVGNSADGEVVTFALQDLGKLYSVNGGLWQPYDSTTSDWANSTEDSADGIIYDSSVDGTVASVVAPTLEDGYEYCFLIEGISPLDFGPSLYKDLTYVSGTGTAEIASSVSSAQAVWNKFYQSRLVAGAGFVGTSFDTVTVNTVTFQFRDSPAGTVRSIDAGIIRMYRRADV